MQNIEKPPICGRDFLALQEERGLKSIDYAWILGMSAPAFGSYKNREAKRNPARMLRKHRHALVIRWMLENEDAEPGLSAPVPSDMIRRLRSLWDGRFSAKRFGILLGAAGGTASSWGSGQHHPMTITQRICSMLHHTDDGLFLERFLAWEAMALDEAARRGIPDLYQAESWRQA